MCVVMQKFVGKLPNHPPVAWEQRHPGFYGVRKEGQVSFVQPGDFGDRLTYVVGVGQRGETGRIQVF